MPATQLKTQAIADAAISTPKIGDGQVTQPKLAPGVGGNTDKSFRLSKSVNQSVPGDNADYSITWDTELFDIDDLHSLSLNTDRVTITTATAGKWLIIGNVHIQGNATATRVIKIKKNGGTITADVHEPVGGNSRGMTISTIINLAAGDFVTMTMLQNTGVALDVGNGSQGNGHFEGIRIAT